MRLIPAAATLAAAAALLAAPALAQVPYIQGTWTLNPARSRLPGPPPRSEVRSYRLRPDGVLVGLSVSVAPNGQPNFLMFAARPDGQDHPEFDTVDAAQYLAAGAPPARTYAEQPTADPRRIHWIDKAAGRIVGSGDRWVSADGKTLTFSTDGTHFLNVFDRTGE